MGTQCPVVDIVVASLSGADVAIKGDAVQLTVVVENAGNRNVVDDVRVVVASDSTTPSKTADDKTITVHKIDGGPTAGESVTFDCTWDTADTPVGTHTVTAQHDMADGDAASDRLQREVTVVGAVTDPGVTAIEMPETAAQGETVESIVEVENVGNLDVTKYVRVTLVGDNATPAVAADDPALRIQTLVRGMAAGAWARLPFTWHTSRAASGTHTLTATLRTYDEDPQNESRAATFTLAKPQPKLTITRVSPYAIQAGTATTMIIAGSGFAEDAQVELDSIEGPSLTVVDVTVTSPNTILARISVDKGQPPVPVICDVRVTNEDGSTGVLHEALTVKP